MKVGLEEEGGGSKKEKMGADKRILGRSGNGGNEVVP